MKLNFYEKICENYAQTIQRGGKVVCLAKKYDIMLTLQVLNRLTNEI